MKELYLKELLLKELHLKEEHVKELHLEPLSMESIISYAYSAKLIDEKLMNDVLDKCPMSQFERTLLLLRNIGKKMCKPEEATVVMKQFLEILESNPAFCPLVKRISENKLDKCRTLWGEPLRAECVHYVNTPRMHWHLISSKCMLL